MPLNDTDTQWISKHLIVKPENADRWNRLTEHATIGHVVAVLQNIVSDVERQLADEDHDPELSKRRRGYLTIAKRRLREVKALQRELNIASNSREDANRKGLRALMRSVDALIEGTGTQRELEDTFHLVGDALEAVGVDLERGGYLS